MRLKNPALDSLLQNCRKDADLLTPSPSLITCCSFPAEPETTRDSAESSFVRFLCFFAPPSLHLLERILNCNQSLPEIHYKVQTSDHTFSSTSCVPGLYMPSCYILLNCRAIEFLIHMLQCLINTAPRNICFLR